MRALLRACCLIFASWVWLMHGSPVFAQTQATPTAKPKPLMREFMGINGHTVLFKPELYAQTCRLVRDYHPLEWDTGAETDYVLDFPFARNRVNWEQVYGSWKQAGMQTDACIQIETHAPTAWRDMAADANRYGRLFAKHFGPSSALSVVQSVEVGNEPGKYSDAEYRTVFENMAQGFRDGDSKLTIATCNVNVGASGDYHKSVQCLAGLEALYDVLNVHTYAMLEQWPTWKRSFPEDSRLPAYWKDVDELIEWRNAHAPGKEVWITEFGWDASTQSPAPTGDFAKWQSNSELEQAQWLVRAFLLFAARDVDRAYLYFFNDDDQPQLHGSSGLTRRFEPKPSFHAVAHLFQTLGDYRFSKVVDAQTDAVMVYEFARGDDPHDVIWVAWSPTGEERIESVELELGSRQLLSASRMPTATGSAPSVESVSSAGRLRLDISESPTYLHLKVL